MGVSEDGGEKASGHSLRPLYFWVRKMIRDQEERQQRVSVEGGTELKGQWL